MKILRKITFVIIIIIAGGNPACADENNLVLRGTLVEPPSCIITGKNKVEISFGEQIGIKKVAQGIYRQPVDLGLECDSGNLSWQLTLKWTGNIAGFDSDNATIRSDEQASLGVKMYAAGQPLALNSVLKVNGNSLPPLEAVLVQEEGVELKEGNFTAHASFLAEFQ
ncbi:fimbrial protein [Enterobacter sp. 22325]|uniref:fimbrial protein n=1 Tax=Enterobacter sp. 22325 TaxID=3453911 RepID=UPI003F830112